MWRFFLKINEKSRNVSQSAWEGDWMQDQRSARSMSGKSKTNDGELWILLNCHLNLSKVLNLKIIKSCCVDSRFWARTSTVWLLVVLLKVQLFLQFLMILAILSKLNYCPKVLLLLAIHLNSCTVDVQVLF